jgi:hypothetical protein
MTCYMLRGSWRKGMANDRNGVTFDRAWPIQGFRGA